MKRLTILVGILAVAAARPALAQPKFPERWNYVPANLQSDKGLDTFLDILQQSKDCGCTHIQMPEGGWIRGADNAAYLARVEKAKAKAKEMGLTIVPQVYALGYGGRYLGFDHNLAAGLPVKDEPFIVKGKTATPDPALTVDLSGLKNGSGKVKVRPFTHYHIQFTRTEGRGGPSVTGMAGNRVLTRRDADSHKDGDKTIIETTFNSLESDEVRVGIPAGATDVKLESAGLLMIVRRDLVPLKVISADGKTIYKEGEDFKPVADPKLTTGGEYVFTHEPPVIELTDNSKIKDGDKLLVSFFHCFRVGGDQDVISMEDPKVFEIMEGDMKNAAKVWNAAGYFMNYDEIRIGGWETPDVKPGKILGDHVKKGYDLVKKYAPNAKVYTWSDMFTPFHNARPFQDGAKVNGYYYLVHGNWDGAWEGLPKDVIIMNWYAPPGKETASLKFFSDRGQPQVLCGYYDAPAPDAMKKNITHWITAAQGVPQVLGIEYTTWKKKYDVLKEYFHLVDTYAEWGKGADPAGPMKEPGVEN